MYSTHATKVFHTIEDGMGTYNDTELNNLDNLVDFVFISQGDVKFIVLNERMNDF